MNDFLPIPKNDLKEGKNVFSFWKLIASWLIAITTGVFFLPGFRSFFWPLTPFKFVFILFMFLPVPIIYFVNKKYYSSFTEEQLQEGNKLLYQFDMEVIKRSLFLKFTLIFFVISLIATITIVIISRL